MTYSKAYTIIQYDGKNVHLQKKKNLPSAYLPKILTNTLHMAATLIGNALELPQSWGTADEVVCLTDGDDAITSVIYDCAFEFENAES